MNGSTVGGMLLAALVVGTGVGLWLGRLYERAKRTWRDWRATLAAARGLFALLRFQWWRVFVAGAGVGCTLALAGGLWLGSR